MTPLTLGSLFDGIGGFPLAGICNGVTPVWASEIEAFPIEVTKIRFPEMLHVGDITKLNGAELPAVDVVCGGSPCQDLSVAGKRAGLKGERSGLFMEQIRIIKELRKEDEKRGGATDSIRPRYMLWENVPGAFSSADGEDFHAVLEETVRIVDGGISIPRPPSGLWKSAGCIMGDEFSVAWRVVDAQYWPFTPQRRRRIFLVADFGGRTAPEILFEQDRLFGNTPQICETWQRTAAHIARGTGSAGGIVGAHHFCGSDRQASPAAHLTGGTSPLVCPPALRGGLDEKPILCLNDQGGDRMDVTEDQTSTLRAGMGGHQPMVAIPINMQLAARGGKDDTFGFGVGSDGDPAYTIQEARGHAVFQSDANCLNSWDTQQSRIFTEDGIAPTLAGADGGGGRNPAGLVLTTEEKSSVLCLNDQGGNQMSVTEDVVGTLRAQVHGHAPIVMGSQQGGAEICTDLCPTLTQAAGTSGNNQPVLLFENHGIDSRYTGPHPVAPTMSARYGTGGNNQPLISQALFEGHGKDARYNGPLEVSPTISSAFGEGGGNIPLAMELPRVFSLDGVESNSMKSSNPLSGCHETDLARTIDTTNPCPSKNQGGLAIVQESYCIAGNIIDRQDHNGGNGCGFQPNISYTLTGADRHAVMDSSTYQQVVGALCSGDEKGIGNQYVSQDKCIIDRLQTINLVRRLTPSECERLQGYPTGWTDIPKCSDSARYKALGNSVAVPCVEYILRGIAYFLRKFREESGEEIV